MQQIHIFKGDSTIFAENNKFLTFNIQTNLDLTNWKAKFYLGKIVKTFNDITSKTFDVILTCNDTSTLDYGNIYGVLKLIDSNNNVKTVNNKIPFVVDNKVIENDYQVISLDIPKSTETNIEIVVGNSGGGTFNYDDLFNKPLINDVVLIGNKTATDLGLISTEEFSSALDTKQDVGDYVTNSSLLEKQYITIDDIPSDISYFNNDSGYITEESDPTVPSWAKQPQKPTYTAEEVGALSSDTVIPDISNLATSQELEEGLATKQDKGDYAIKSEIPSNTSDLINDSNFITNSVDNLVNYTKSSDLSTVATSGSYEDLKNKPSIPDTSGLATKDELNLKADKTSIPTNVSQLANDSGFITSIPQEYITETELESKGYLTSIPDTVQLKSDSSLNTSNKTVSGAINEINTELSNKANSTDIPSSVSELTNDSGFITNSVNNLLNYTKTSDLSTVATSGSYNDLQDKPVIPVVPENILSKPTESILEEASVTISILNSNYKYICSNPITSLNITALDSTKCEIETTIIFTTGDTISVSIPEDIKIVGDYNFEPNKNYIMCFWENNLVSAEAKSQT